MAAGKLDIDYYNAYHPYADHIHYLNDLHALYPNNSEIVVPGDSVNGNPITGIHFYGNDGPGKPAVVIHGTVHAREWITTMVSNECVDLLPLSKHNFCYRPSST